MPLSGARPIVVAPGGAATDAPDHRTRINVAAMFDNASVVRPACCLIRLGGGSCCGTGRAVGECPSPNVNPGPSGPPRWMISPSRMSTEGTRWRPTNIPLRLSLSIATQRESRQRSTT